MLKELKHKSFANGHVYLLETDTGHKVETTDTFLPYYTKDCINENSNKLKADDLGSRFERWMVGVSTMSGCPVGCKFCATGQMDKVRLLSAQEIVDQVEFVINKNALRPSDAKEFKINYTRMGEPFLNIEAVRAAVEIITAKYPNTHHYISTIGVQGSDFSWIKDNITLQLSVHSLDNARRKELIPVPYTLSLEELGAIRTDSKLLTTINLTLVDEKDFDIVKLTKLFDPKYFFIKLSPINTNAVSTKNGLGDGVIVSENIV
jgi:23S rRNA (adenine2503-C2)-methyltransferase